MIELRTVLHEEAVRTGEFVFLRGQNDDIEFEVGQVRAGEFEAGRVVRIFDVDRT